MGFPGPRASRGLARRTKGSDKRVGGSRSIRPPSVRWSGRTGSRRGRSRPLFIAAAGWSVGRPMGLFDIPTVKRTPNGILALVLCILLGGIGTIIVGAIDDRGNDKKGIVILGVIQLLLSFIVIGWIWAIVWGILVFVRSSDA